MIVERVERHIFKFNKDMDRLCFLSKNLYNYCNYLVRQEFISNHRFINEYDLTGQLTKNNQVDYRALPAKVSLLIIKVLFNNWKSFFKLTKDYSRSKFKYAGRPNLPKYKSKYGRSIVIFTNQAARIRNGYIEFAKLAQLKPVKTNITNDQFLLARIIPQSNCYILEIIYKTLTVDLDLAQTNYLSIDLGIDNFATCYNSHDNKSFIVNGKIIKSMNQYYNKKRAKLMSYIKDRGTSNRLKLLDLKRNNKINDFMHKVSKFIINYCVKYNIGTVVIGHNKDWKRDTNIGRVNNQKFTAIPFNSFINKLKYKCENLGIDFILTEESYTSKVDHSILELMGHHETYAGKRIQRGLFRQSSDKVLNADLNGAVGILRKVIDESSFKKIINRGFVLNPVKINILTKNNI